MGIGRHEWLQVDRSVGEVRWCAPGHTAAMDNLRRFCNKNGLGLCAKKRNDPNTPKALSNMSPYYHYGSIAPQRAILKVSKFQKFFPEGVKSYIEEAVVRRELSDNFCYYNNAHYDKVTGTAQWAQDSLA